MRSLFIVTQVTLRVDGPSLMRQPKVIQECRLYSIVGAFMYGFLAFTIHHSTRMRIQHSSTIPTIEHKVKTGDDARCITASISKRISGQCTSSRFVRRQIQLETTFLNVATFGMVPVQDKFPDSRYVKCRSPRFGN